MPLGEVKFFQHLQREILIKTFKPLEKIYFLPTCKTCPQTCGFCDDLGFKSSKNKSTIEFKRSLQKALSGQYKYVLLPCNSIHSFEFDQWVELTLAAGLIPMIQINLEVMNDLMEKAIEKYSAKGCVFQFLVSSASPVILENLRLVEKMPIQKFYATVMNKTIGIDEILKLIPAEVRNVTGFYLPLKKKRFDGNYSCYQLDKKMKRLRKQFPEAWLKPVEGLDQYDPRISPDLELEPVTKPLLVNSISSAEKIKISVIIPAYNNQNYIQNNIRHLSQQTLNREEFELILVNDGSSDNTGERIKQMLNSLPPMNYKYFYVPRPRKRFMGDAQFRAGIARNLGVKYASGKYISFLDADMITPKNYLENLLTDLQSYDVIQTQRHYLKGQISTNQTNYDELVPEDTYVPERGYWHEFYSDKRDWNTIEAGWKYVCTYSLTMAKKEFVDAGWFRKTYMFYGFEDTDLGYRLFKRDKKFKLSPMRIYHLFQHNERSEYSNSEYLRQALLSKTSQIFYRNYLDDQIFFHLKSLINDGPGLEDLLPGFR